MTTTARSRTEQLRTALGRMPRVSLGWLNTPLEPMPRLSDALDGPPIWFKRDDLTGLAFGGNKTRMLEFSLAGALERGADTVVTGAAVQSNYCRQMAGACAKLGLECHLILRPEREIDRTRISGNNLVQRLLGAHVTVLPDRDRTRQKEAISARADELRREGRTVFIPRQDDTVDLDAIAYAEAALEIVEQCRGLGIEPRFLYVAAADTTQAGLVLGLRWLESNLHVRGISPSATPGLDERMAAIANRAAGRLGLDIHFNPGDFDNDLDYVGERYGIPTEAGLAAVDLVARREGILLDPVYTGKAMSALVDHINGGRLDTDEPVLFLHTGGVPALFSYQKELEDAGLLGT